jgi:hypothetical protein
MAWQSTRMTGLRPRTRFEARRAAGRDRGPVRGDGDTTTQNSRCAARKRSGAVEGPKGGRQ